MSKFAEITADDERLDMPLSQALLSAEWHLLAAPIRAVHERRPVTLVGRATVVRGWWWGRIGCRWMPVGAWIEASPDILFYVRSLYEAVRHSYDIR